MPRFPEEYIDRIREATSIRDIVGDYIALKRSGKHMKALCPFHSERTPSFTVSENTGLFYCYGCHKGGNVFNFLMEIESISFPEAIRQLANRAGIPLPTTEADARGMDLLSSNRWAHEKFRRYFVSGIGVAARAAEYLAKRGVTEESVKAFGLAACPDQWQFLARIAEKEGISFTLLEDAGLVLKRRDDSGYIDRFRNRLIFPLHSPSGEILGFAGRVLPGNNDKAKYVNSPESSVYKKSRFIYGFHEAKTAIREKGIAILVEGYLDVIQCHQYGFDETVSVSGTSLTEEQVQMLGRRVSEVVILFDGDDPGQSAAERAVKLLLGRGISARVGRMPKNEDPDSLLNKSGREALQGIINESLSPVAFLAARMPDSVRKHPRDAVRKIAQVLATMPDPLMREDAAKEIASRFPVSVDGVLATVRIEATRVRMTGKEPEIPQTIRIPRASALEEQICRHLLLRPAEREEILEELHEEQFRDSALSKLFAWISANAGLTEANKIVERIEDDELRHIASGLIVSEKPLEPMDEELARMKLATLKRESQVLKDRTREAEEHGDIEGLKALSEEQLERAAEAERLKAVIKSSSAKFGPLESQ